MQKPYRKPFVNELAEKKKSQNKVVYLFVAIAILLTAIPILFLVLKGWLAPKSTEEPMVIHGTDSSYSVETPQSIPMVEELAITQPIITEPVVEEPMVIAEPIIDEPAVVVEPVAEVPAVVVEPPVVTPPVVPEPVAVVAPPPVVAEPIAVVAPPPPAVVIEEPVVVVEPVAEPEPTQPKRTFRALTPAELAKLKKSEPTVKPTTQQLGSYNERLYSYVRGQWVNPSPVQLQNKKYKATISLEVSSDGTIKNVKFVTPSFNNVMDNSVRALIQKLQKGKAPAPGFNTGTIRIELQN